MTWTPHVTVAAILEMQGRFLMVEEETPDGIRYNQPAGHLEAQESLIAAIQREVLEESAWQFQPAGLVGIYRWQLAPGETTYLRFCFHGSVTAHDPQRPLDQGIRAALWLPLDTLRLQSRQMRSPLVLRSLNDYLNGSRYPLELLHELAG